MMSDQLSTRPKINWLAPDYEDTYRYRAEALRRIREKPGAVPALLSFYSTRWVEFINDWMMTYDPRKLASNEKPVMPFVLFERQEEFVNWVYERWRSSERGLACKCRDVGFSWLAAACAVCVWLFYDEANIGFGSRKKESVDNGDDDPDSLFWKIRKLISLLPDVFIPEGYGQGNKLSLIVNPRNRSTIKGEVGDNIGMGGRTTIFFVDEADSLEHQQLAEIALSGTTDCRIDISTENNVGSVFYNKKRSLPSRQVFEFDWWQDPRKRQRLDLPKELEPWYIKKRGELTATAFASQVDRNPNAALANTFIPIQLITDAEQRSVSRIEQAPTVAWRLGIDASGMGNDETVLWPRLGRISLPPTRFSKIDGVQLAMQVLQLAKDLLKTAPLELVCIEQDGPGGSCADQLRYTWLSPVLRSLHTGKRLSDGRHYNLRAYLHAQAKEYLEDQQPFIPRNSVFRSQATSILFENRAGTLLIESKDDYRKRLSGATRREEKLSSRSPDHWDSFMLTFYPVNWPPIKTITPVNDFSSGYVWKPLDSMMGY